MPDAQGNTQYFHPLGREVQITEYDGRNSRYPYNDRDDMKIVNFCVCHSVFIFAAYYTRMIPYWYMSETTEPDRGQIDPQGSSNGILVNKPKGRHGGPRPNSGRPKGGMNASTKERLAIRHAFETRIHYNADRLLTAAMNKALGESFLYCKSEVGEGSKKHYETELITDPYTIQRYIDGELNESGSDEYYYISTKPVDMTAVKELYDRAFGKSVQRNELSGPEGEPLAMSPEQAAQVIALRAERAGN